MVFSGDSMPDVVNPSFEVVSAAIRQISPRGPGYFSLTLSDRSYLQVTGATLRLTVEYRKTEHRSFHHFVLGIAANPDRSRKQINSVAGAIDLLANEVLTADDAIEAFRSFWETGAIPQRFSLRDDTDRFMDMETT